MRTGLLLDNQDYPSDESYAKLRAMGASCVGMLWTAGTHHRRDVYQGCERELRKPLYVLRVGGHPQTPAEWLADARAALSEVPIEILLQDRVMLTAGNEPNIEFSENGADYGRFYAALNASTSSVPILFACPSLGLGGWSRYLAAALAEAGRPRCGIVNLYAGSVGRIGDFAGMFDEVYVGEVNSAPDVRGDARCAFLRDAFTRFDRNRVRAALVFIAGGRSYGAWDEGYIISEDEAHSLLEWRMTEMAWDRHKVYDEWQKLFGGQGYNPADAFGKIIRDNPDREFGVFVGGYCYEEPFIYAYTTVGIFCYDKRTGKALFATSEEELPLA